MKSLGIDIGSSSIKIVEMQSTSKGFQVLQFTEHPLKITPGEDQELEIIEFLRDFLSRFDPHKTHFIFGLRQDRVAVRNKFFPFNDRIKISKSLAFELEEDLPFSFENAIFDAKIIRSVGSGAEVLACAAPKNHVHNALMRANDVGVDPYTISAEGISFANIFEKWNEAPPTITAAPFSIEEESTKVPRYLNIVLNIGHTRTLMNVFEGNSLIAVRSILWGGKNISEAISKKYEIPFLDAVREVNTKAFILTNKQGATFDQVTFSDTIAKTVRELARDLQLSILELKSEFNAQIQNITLMGGVSQMQNLGPFLTQTLEVPVNPASALDLVPNVQFERTAERGAKAGVALGLAIEGFKKPRNPAINFLRGDFAKQNHFFKQMWEKWGHTAKIGASFILILFIYSSLRSTLAEGLEDRTQDALKSQAKSVAGIKKATMENIKKYISENRKRTEKLKNLKNIAGMNSALDILKKISDASPSKSFLNIEVHEFKIEDSQVRIQGYVNSQKELDLFRKTLAGVSADGAVKEESINLNQMLGKTTFSFSLNVDRGIQKVTR